MTSSAAFPDGYLLVREFLTMSDAHVLAGSLAAMHPGVRLVDVSPTAGGAWVCAWFDQSPEAFSDTIPIGATLMNAVLSLGPKTSETATHIGILESDSIREVIAIAGEVARAAGEKATLLEIRVKRSGTQKGAYAFFALEAEGVVDFSKGDQLSSATKSVHSTVVPLVGDYRRFFF